MEEAWFLWKGESSLSRGLRVLAYPAAGRAAAAYRRVEIPGRSGLVTLTDPPVYEAAEREIRFLMPPEAQPGAVLAWLAGAGRLVLGNEPDRALAAEAEGAMALERCPDGTREGTVRFLVQPLKEEYPPEPVVPITANGDGETEITARGDVPARPVYRVEGTGEIVLTVGDATEDGTGSVLSIDLEEGMDGFVVDTDAAMVTSLDGTENLCSLCELFYNGFRGLWLPVGETTTISWTGSVTSVSIDPRWRWL